MCQHSRKYCGKVPAYSPSTGSYPMPLTAAVVFDRSPDRKGCTCMNAGREDDTDRGPPGAREFSPLGSPSHDPVKAPTGGLLGEGSSRGRGCRLGGPGRELQWSLSTFTRGPGRLD